jgi:DNA-binding FadR family transcriptional regulator
MLPAVAVESAVDACVRTLKRAILGQELAIGEKLPAERELASHRGVSRNPLRAADLTR